MGSAYPHFKSSYSHEELVQQFLLTPADLQLLLACRGEANRCGMAPLLKALPYLGYVPEALGRIPREVRVFIANQLGCLWDPSADYPWHSSTRDYHLAQVRQHTGWRFPTAQDKAALEDWLRHTAAYEAHTAEALFGCACDRLRALRVELPAEGELQRLVGALHGFFQDVHRAIAAAFPTEVRTRIDAMLLVPEGRSVSPFEDLKADPGKPAFRAAFRKRRCLILADGFYEWKKENRHKQPFHIRLRDGRSFAFAGLWEHWEGPEGKAIHSCTILTASPNELLRPLHHRMAVILDSGDYDLWLDPAIQEVERLQPLLRPYPPETMTAYPVSTRVNNPANDHPECVEPIRRD